MTTTAVAVTFDEMTRLSEAIASSGLFGMKTPAQALALMAIAQAEGQHPALAARDYHVVQGRPVLRADAMLSRFQSSGGRMKMLCYSDQKVEAEFTHPQGGTVTVDWTIERAAKAGLTNRDNWKNYPRQMLRARVISEGVRTVFPGAVVGMYTPEEVADEAPQERDITPAKLLTGVAALAARVETLASADATVASGDGGFELTPPTVEEQILAQLREKSLEGGIALKEAWDGMGKDLRVSLKDHLPSLKEAAAKVDAAQAGERG